MTNNVELLARAIIKNPINSRQHMDSVYIHVISCNYYQVLFSFLIADQRFRVAESAARN